MKFFHWSLLRIFQYPTAFGGRKYTTSNTILLKSYRIRNALTLKHYCTINILKPIHYLNYKRCKLEVTDFWNIISGDVRLINLHFQSPLAQIVNIQTYPILSNVKSLFWLEHSVFFCECGCLRLTTTRLYRFSLNLNKHTWYKE